MTHTHQPTIERNQYEKVFKDAIRNFRFPTEVLEERVSAHEKFHPLEIYNNLKYLYNIMGTIGGCEVELDDKTVKFFGFSAFGFSIEHEQKDTISSEESSAIKFDVIYCFPPSSIQKIKVLTSNVTWPGSTWYSGDFSKITDYSFYNTDTYFCRALTPVIGFAEHCRELEESFIKRSKVNYRRDCLHLIRQMQKRTIE